MDDGTIRLFTCSSYKPINRLLDRTLKLPFGNRLLTIGPSDGTIGPSGGAEYLVDPFPFRVGKKNISP